MVGRIKRLTVPSRPFMVAASLLTVLTVGLVDYATSPEISFSVFYLLALGMAVWFVGRGFACVIAVFSMAVSLAGDLATGSRHSSLLVLFWNESIVLAFYFVVVWLLTRIRLLTKGLEARVRERTAALTEEIAERERLERELLEISEREQRRIGHDLHDSLGQHLTGAALAAQVLEEKLAARGLAEAADANKVVDIVEEGIVLTRKLAKGLHPIEIEAEGLMNALEELAVTSSELFKIPCRFECDSPVLIRDAPASGHMYRIAQEAVTNAVKHGKARHIVIHLETLGDGLAMLVKDDGIGLPEPLPEKRGMGLRIMAHRASIIGAAFSARRERAGGTTVTCILRRGHPAEKVLHEQSKGESIPGR